MGLERFRKGPSSGVLARVPEFKDVAGVRQYLDTLVRALRSEGDVQTIAARVYRSTTQSVTNGTTAAISFDTERTDNGGLWDSSVPTRLTAPIGGWYGFGFSVGLTAVDAAVGVYVLLNGATQITPTMDFDEQRTMAHSVWPFSAADYIEFIVDNGSASTRTVASTAAWSPEAWMIWQGPVQE